MPTSLIRSNKYMQDITKGPGEERVHIVLHHFPDTFSFSIRCIVLLMISYLILPGKKVSLSVLGISPLEIQSLAFVVFRSPCLKGKWEFQNMGKS